MSAGTAEAGSSVFRRSPLRLLALAVATLALAWVVTLAWSGLPSPVFGDDSPGGERPVALRHLLTHTSGAHRSGFPGRRRHSITGVGHSGANTEYRALYAAWPEADLMMVAMSAEPVGAQFHAEIRDALAPSHKGSPAPIPHAAHPRD